MIFKFREPEFFKLIEPDLENADFPSSPLDWSISEALTSDLSDAGSIFSPTLNYEAVNCEMDENSHNIPNLDVDDIELNKMMEELLEKDNLNLIDLFMSDKEPTSPEKKGSFCLTAEDVIDLTPEDVIGELDKLCEISKLETMKLEPDTSFEDCLGNSFFLPGIDKPYFYASDFSSMPCDTEDLQQKLAQSDIPPRTKQSKSVTKKTKGRRTRRTKPYDRAGVVDVEGTNSVPIVDEPQNNQMPWSSRYSSVIDVADSEEFKPKAKPKSKRTKKPKPNAKGVKEEEDFIFRPLHIPPGHNDHDYCVKYEKVPVSRHGGDAGLVSGMSSPSPLFNTSDVENEPVVKRAPATKRKPRGRRAAAVTTPAPSNRRGTTAQRDHREMERRRRRDMKAAFEFLHVSTPQESARGGKKLTKTPSKAIILTNAAAQIKKIETLRPNALADARDELSHLCRQLASEKAQLRRKYFKE